MSEETLMMVFDQYDMDNVGCLDRVAFEQFLVELGRADLPPDHIERCFGIVDRNGDGRVTRDNFVRYVPYLYEVDFNPPQRIRKKVTESTKSSGKKAGLKTKPGDPATFFTKVKKLGKGSYGVVYKAIDVRSDEIIALKIIEIEGNEELMEDVQREVSFMANCNSPFVVKYYGSYLRGTELWIAMEYVSAGSLLDILKRQPITENYARIIIRSIVRGLAYLHSENKIHRDIKAANVLVTQEGDVKLANFGVAASLYGTVAVKNTFAGSPLWMAPEIIQQKPQTFAVDIWSLGITAIEVVKGVPPKCDMHPMQVLFSIPEDPAPILDGNYSPEFKSFVAACLNKDPALRPTATILLTHPFLMAQDKQTLMEMLLKHEQMEAAQERISRVSMAIDQEISELRASRPASFWDFTAEDSTVEPDVQDKEEEARQKFEPSMIDPGSELGLVLSRLQLLHLASIFKENDIDLDAFLLLDDQDLKDLGIKLGNRKKLLHMIPVLRRELGFSLPELQEDLTQKSGSDSNATASASSTVTRVQRQQFSAASPIVTPLSGANTPPLSNPPTPKPPAISSAAVEPNEQLTASAVADLPLPHAKDVASWTVAQVGRWLYEQGLSDHIQSFLDNKIDGEALKGLELESLKELGLKLVGERVKFLSATRKLLRPAVPQGGVPGSMTVVEDGYYSDGESIVENYDSSEANSVLEKDCSADSSDLSIPPLDRRNSTASTGSKRRKSLPQVIFNRSSSFARKPLDPVKREELQQRLSVLQLEQSTDDHDTKSPGSASSSSPKPGTALKKKKTLSSQGSPVSNDKANAPNLKLPTPSIVPEHLKSPTHSGWLMKQGGQRKNWKKRWMVLDGCVLYYFKSQKGSKAKGAIMLPSYNLWIAGEIKKKFSFKLQHVSARTYYFQADNYEQMRTWMNYLHAATRAYESGTIQALNASLVKQSAELEAVHSSDDDE